MPVDLRHDRVHDGEVLRGQGRDHGSDGDGLVARLDPRAVSRGNDLVGRDGVGLQVADDVFHIQGAQYHSAER